MMTIAKGDLAKPAAATNKPFPIVLASVSMSMAVFVIISILVTRVYMVRMFEDFELDLPALTQLAVSPILPSVLTILTVIGAAAIVIPLNANVAKYASRGLFCIASLVLVLYLWGVFVPLMKMAEALST